MQSKEISIDLSLNGTKLQQLIDGITRGIQDEKYIPGDILPSVNQLSRDLAISRDTVFKAYKELKRRGLVESVPTKGYRVCTTTTRVLMFLDSFSIFKDVLFNSFVSNLPANYTVDLAFHHYNEQVYEAVILNSIGKYNYYILMNISGGKLSKAVNNLDPNKLLMIDWGDLHLTKYPQSYVMQDFGQSVYNCLVEALPEIRKFDEFVLFFHEDSWHPRITEEYFVRFCKDFSLKFRIERQNTDDLVKKGSAYFILREQDLMRCIKVCRDQKLEPGRDVGIMSYNDTPAFEVIGDGITIITTDFAEMGRQAAKFVTNREKMQYILPTRLISRGSL